MWLLDTNVPDQVLPLLLQFGIQSELARQRGWERLRNGELLSAASQAGFVCILTRDILFKESAAQALKRHQQMAIVLLTLPQAPSETYVRTFEAAWRRATITPVPGKLVSWP